MEIAVWVTIAMFSAGVIYHSGRLSVRVEHLEDWRRAMDHKLEKIDHGIDNIREALNARKVQ